MNKSFFKYGFYSGLALSIIVGLSLYFLFFKTPTIELSKINYTDTNGNLIDQKIALKEEIISKGLLDTIDRLIITLLSQGFRNVTISDKLGLSTSAVEKRKATIKDHLGIIKGTDEDIIKESRRLGYI